MKFTHSNCLANVPWPAFKRFFVNARTKVDYVLEIGGKGLQPRIHSEYWLANTRIPCKAQFLLNEKCRSMVTLLL